MARDLLTHKPPLATTRPSLTVALLQAREATMQFFRPSLHAHDLTEQQWRIIRTLSQYGELESHRLAELVCVLKPSMTGILNRMARDKLIHKRKAEHDQRRIYVGLSKQGQARYAQMASEIEANYRRLQKRFSAKKLAQLMKLLNELKQITP